MCHIFCTKEYFESIKNRPLDAHNTDGRRAREPARSSLVTETLTVATLGTGADRTGHEGTS